MAEMTVADVSRWQGTINWDEFKNHIGGVVIKVSGADGGLYKDGLADRNKNEARRVGTPRWYYHFKGSGSARDQAAFMLRSIGDIQTGEGIVLDDENEGHVNTGFAAEFTDAVKEMTGGVINVLYSNLARFQGVELAPVRDRNVGAWVAKFGANNGTVAGAGSPPGGINIPIIMWQYTSTARIPGVSENTVDMNVFYGGPDQFKAYGAKGNVPAPAPAPAAPASTGDGYYVVQSGDYLSKIGPKVGVPWGTIAATNGIVAPFTIFPGQRLRIFGGAPAQAASPASGSYLVVSGDYLIGIGAKTGHDWHAIADMNGLKAPYTIFPGQHLALPGGAPTPAASTESTYTVVSGDGLILIGQKTGKDWHAIASLNNIPAPYVIFPNQVLRLP